MYKTYLFLVIGCCCASSNLGAQITITRSGFGFQAGSYPINQMQDTGQLQPGGGQTWDSDPVTAGFAGTATLQFLSTTDFPNALLNPSFAYLNPTYGFNITSVVQISDSGVREIAETVEEQHYGLSAFTGNTKDSLNFPKQTATMSGSRYLIKFPATTGGAWSSTYHYSVDGVLTVAAFGLSKTPMSKSTTVTYIDSVYAWGRARIPTTGTGGLSNWIDVLCVKRKVVTVDSLFLAGQPAPTALLTGLGATQGMVTKNYRYIFWRPNVVALMNINYGTDSTYSLPATVNLDASVPTASSGVDHQAFAGSPAAFPNPAQDQVTISFNKPTALCVIEFVNAAGVTVQSTPVLSPAGPVQVPVSVRDLPNGAYRYVVRNETGGMLAGGTLNVVK